MITYPKELPRPLQDGYELQTASPKVETSFQSGRTIERRAFTSVPTQASVKWLMTESQARYFEAWFEEVLVSGTKWFECELSTPLGFAPYTARIKGMYDGPVQITKGWWQFTATLELRKRPILQPGWAIYAPQYILLANVFDKAMNQEWPESRYQTYMPEFDQSQNREWPPQA
jgi:hypothetical protein